EAQRRTQRAREYTKQKAEAVKEYRTFLFETKAGKMLCAVAIGLGLFAILYVTQGLVAQSFDKAKALANALTANDKSATAAPEVLAAVGPEVTVKEITHQVAPNDNLTKIAALYGTTVAELMDLNVGTIADEDSIYVGQVLVI